MADSVTIPEQAAEPVLTANPVSSETSAESAFPREPNLLFPNLPIDETMGPLKSKNARKKEERFLKKAEQIKQRRPLEKAKRKEKKLASRQRQQRQATAESPYVTKKAERKMLRDKLNAAMINGVKLCVDMSFSEIMSLKEIGQLASQINYMYSSNKKMQNPFCMHLCSLEKGSLLRDQVEKRCPGFENYKLKVFEEPLETIFPKEDLIYLSPDSENVLEKVDPKKVYIIGGLVDGTPKREVSLTRAKGIGCETARLPITEYMTRVTPHGYNTILTLNQVYEILMRFHETKSWETALKDSVPQRKGFALTGESVKEGEIDSSSDIQTSSDVVVKSDE